MLNKFQATIAHFASRFVYLSPTVWKARLHWLTHFAVTVLIASCTYGDLAVFWALNFLLVLGAVTYIAAYFIHFH